MLEFPAIVPKSGDDDNATNVKQGKSPKSHSQVIFYASISFDVIWNLHSFYQSSKIFISKESLVFTQGKNVVKALYLWRNFKTDYLELIGSQ